MKKLKQYKRWPRNEDILKIKLHKICKVIDKMLEQETPFDVLMTAEGQKLYSEKFTELFLQVGYKFDSKPKFKFEWINKLCGGGIGIYLIYKNRKGNEKYLYI